MDSHKRSVIKTVTWRVITVFVAFGFTYWATDGKISISIWATVWSQIVSTILFYFHERLWNRVKWGRK